MKIHARKMTALILTLLLLLSGVPGLFMRPLSAEAEEAPPLEVLGTPAVESLVRSHFEAENSEETVLSETAVQRLEAIPEILIDSEDARAANEELRQLEDAILPLLDALPETPEAEWGFIYSYTAASRGKLFSLCFRLEGMEPTGTLAMGRYIYNFDLGTGERLNDDCLLAAWLGEPEDPQWLPLVLEANIAHAAEEACEEDRAYIESQTSEGTSDEERGAFPAYLRRGKILAGPLAYAAEGRVTGLEHALDEPEASRLFLDWVDGEALLSMVYAQYLDSRSDAIAMEKPLLLFPEERSVNPLYTQLLAAVGRDADEDPEVQALTLHLGAAYDRATIEAVSGALGNLRAQLGDGDTPSPMPLLALAVDEEGRIVASLDQLFLVVPRYEEDAMEFARSEIAEDGTLRRLDEDIEEVETWHQYGKGWGLLGIMTETFPTGILQISNLSGAGEWWAPMISGMDGSILVPDDVLDLTEEAQTLLNDGGSAPDSELRDLLYGLMPWVE